MKAGFTLRVTLVSLKNKEQFTRTFSGIEDWEVDKRRTLRLFKNLPVPDQQGITQRVVIATYPKGA